MDIIKQKQRKPQAKLTIACIFALILLIGFYLLTRNNQASLAKNGLLIANVKQGDLIVTVDGYGKLASEQLKLITATTNATVSMILLKPGAEVSKNSVIAVLENPYLIQQLKTEQQQLSQFKANLRQLEVDQQREQLAEQAMLTEIQSQYQSARLKRQAQQQLVTQGIVSQIGFQQSQLTENQLQTRVEIFTARLQKLALVHQEALNIQQQQIQQQLSKLANVKQQISELKVKANFNGVIQKMAVTLGQSLQAGQEIAVIGSNKRLLAEILIPQNQAQLIELKQQVAIDTRQQIITGEVARIDPIVNNHMVRLDIKLTEPLPDDARPEQNVDARIKVKVLANARYIEKPINAKAQSQHTLYRVNHSQDSATAIALTLGEVSGRYIEITSAVKPGERFIISDLSNYQNSNIRLH